MIFFHASRNNMPNIILLLFLYKDKKHFFYTISHLLYYI
jgi:hypothetical protein